MFNIHFKNINIDFSFNGLKILNFTYPNLLAKEILTNNSTFSESERNIKKTNIVYINEFSKLIDFLSLNKSSFLLKKVVDLIQDNNLINNQLLIDLIHKLNDWIGLDYVEINEGDQIKIINLLLEVSKEIYLDEKSFKFLLENDFWTEKTLFIFDNVSWINLDYLLQHLNLHYFLILAVDFRNYINYFNELELVCLVNEKYESIDLLDHEKLIDYLELKMNMPITNDVMNDFLNKKQSKVSWDIFFHILNILDSNY